MKFSIEKTALKQALSRMSSMIGASDMLAGVLTITADSFAGVSLRRTSQLGQMKLELTGGVVEDDGTSSVNFDVMSNAVSRIESERIDFAKGDGELRIEAKKVKIKIGEYLKEEIPEELKAETDAPDFTVNSKTLSCAIATCIPAVGKDKARAQFMGMGFRVMNNRLCVFASNARAIHYFELEDSKENLKDSEDGQYDEGYFIPTESISPIAKMIEGKDCNISLYFSDRKVVFLGEGFEMQSPINEQGLPNLQKAFDRMTVSHTAKLNKTDAKRACETAVAVLAMDASPCFLIAEAGVVRVFALGDNKASYDEEIDGSASGDFKKKMNAVSLKDMIAVNSGETIEIELGEFAVSIKSDRVYTQLALMNG